jgi:hypothetical protein
MSDPPLPASVYTTLPPTFSSARRADVTCLCLDYGTAGEPARHRLKAIFDFDASSYAPKCNQS